jgi:hypothetical protein
MTEILVGRLGRSAPVPDLGHDGVGDGSISAGAVDADAGVVDDDRGAALGEQARIGATEPTACTGHERNLPGEIDHGTQP